MRLSEPFEKNRVLLVAWKYCEPIAWYIAYRRTGKATLDVIGIFGDTFAALTSASSDLGRVVGVIENGDPVTLGHCFCKERTVNFGGISKSTIYARFVLIGVQYDEGESTTFSKFTFSVEGLDEWLSISGLRVEHDWDARSASIQFIPPQEIILQLPDGLCLAFTFGWTLPGPTVTEAKITQKAYISLTSESLRSIAPGQAEGTRTAEGRRRPASR